MRFVASGKKTGPGSAPAKCNGAALPLPKPLCPSRLPRPSARPGSSHAAIGDASREPETANHQGGTLDLLP